MVSGVNNLGQYGVQPESYRRQLASTESSASLTSFSVEDEAIISSEANLLNELEKFNSGEGDAIDLALASVMAKITVGAVVNVIQTQNDMFDSVMEMCE